MELSNLLQLTNEQQALLNEIAEKLNQFRQIGGRILFDTYYCDIWCYNGNNIKEIAFADGIEREHYYADYAEINDYLVSAPFSIDSFCSDNDYVLVKVERDKNMF